jgi:two-component system phosphate regulon response regulator OmpR
MATQILVIDDDRELAALLKGFLGKSGFELICAYDGEEGLRLLRKRKPAAIILDLMLPGKDGFEVCKEIRGQSQVPILMLTAKGELTDRVVGLELGADDYLPKPFEPRELLARLRSILRRAAAPSKPKDSPAKLKSGGLLLDTLSRIASLKGKPLGLTSSEFDMLRLFMEQAGSTLNREQIMESVHAESSEAFNRSVDLAVSRLRAKLGDPGKKPKYIKTIWGTGYMFASEVRRDAA